MNKTYSKGRRPVSSKNNKNYNKGLPSLNQSRPMIDPNGTYIPKEDTENLNKTIIDLKRTINNNKADDTVQTLDTDSLMKPTPSYTDIGSRTQS